MASLDCCHPTWTWPSPAAGSLIFPGTTARRRSNPAMYNFHVDFKSSTNSTFTGPTLIPIAAYKPSCPGATVVPAHRNPMREATSLRL